MNDHELAAAIAEAAGALLLELRPTISDPTELKAAGDARANVVILDWLARERPDDAVLSEESADDLARVGRERVWIVDRPPAITAALEAALGAELVPMGSAGAKAMAILQGRVDVYAHAGGQYQWDSAAPVAVCAAAGLHVSRLDGSPLVYNEAERALPDLLICRPEYAASVIEVANT